MSWNRAVSCWEIIVPLIQYSANVERRHFSNGFVETYAIDGLHMRRCVGFRGFAVFCVESGSDFRVEGPARHSCQDKGHAEAVFLVSGRIDNLPDEQKTETFFDVNIPIDPYSTISKKIPVMYCNFTMQFQVLLANVSCSQRRVRHHEPWIHFLYWAS